MIKRKFTKSELETIQDLCVVQFGEGYLLATKVAGQKLQDLEFLTEEGESHPIKAEDMMEIFPTDPFWYSRTFRLIVASIIAIGSAYVLDR